MRSSRAGVVLATLFAGTFVMGSAELVVVGILELVARDLGVSVRAAGLLVTAYALGIAVGGPVLTALPGRRPRPRRAHRAPAAAGGAARVARAVRRRPRRLARPLLVRAAARAARRGR